MVQESNTLVIPFVPTCIRVPLQSNILHNETTLVYPERKSFEGFISNHLQSMCNYAHKYRHPRQLNILYLPKSLFECGSSVMFKTDLLNTANQLRELGLYARNYRFNNQGEGIQNLYNELKEIKVPKQFINNTFTHIFDCYDSCRLLRPVKGWIIEAILYLYVAIARLHLDNYMANPLKVDLGRNILFNVLLNFIPIEITYKIDFLVTTKNLYEIMQMLKLNTIPVKHFNINVFRMRLLKEFMNRLRIKQGVPNDPNVNRENIEKDLFDLILLPNPTNRTSYQTKFHKFLNDYMQTMEKYYMQYVLNVQENLAKALLSGVVSRALPQSSYYHESDFFVIADPEMQLDYFFPLPINFTPFYNKSWQEYPASMTLNPEKLRDLLESFIKEKNIPPLQFPFNKTSKELNYVVPNILTVAEFWTAMDNIRYEYHEIKNALIERTIEPNTDICIYIVGDFDPVHSKYFQSLMNKIYTGNPETRFLYSGINDSLTNFMNTDIPLRSKTKEEAKNRFRKWYLIQKVVNYIANEREPRRIYSDDILHVHDITVDKSESTGEDMSFEAHSDQTLNRLTTISEYINSDLSYRPVRRAYLLMDNDYQVNLLNSPEVLALTNHNYPPFILIDASKKK
jgi:hypothetical protein